MELINKQHKDIATRKDTMATTITVSTMRIYFSGATCKMAGIQGGKYVHFILEDANCWAFVVNNNPAGFKVFNYNRDKNLKSLCIHSTGLIYKMKKTLGIKTTAKYYVSERTSTFEGDTVFEILTNRPIRPNHS